MWADSVTKRKDTRMMISDNLYKLTVLQRVTIPGSRMMTNDNMCLLTVRWRAMIKK